MYRLVSDHIFGPLGFAAGASKTAKTTKERGGCGPQHLQKAFQGVVEAKEVAPTFQRSLTKGAWAP